MSQCYTTIQRQGCRYFCNKPADGHSNHAATAYTTDADGHTHYFFLEQPFTWVTDDDRLAFKELR